VDLLGLIICYDWRGERLPLYWIMWFMDVSLPSEERMGYIVS